MAKKTEKSQPIKPSPDGAVEDKLYRLKITLNGVTPPVWRRVLVPADTPLDILHAIIQIAMGWQDMHLHQFRAKGKTYAAPNPEGILYDEDEDESESTLAEIAPAEKAKFFYDYDFGDGWEHTIVVEKILPLDPEAEYPICTGGERACPPDDSGGPWGYAEKLTILADPRHPEHREIKEWIGEDFDPEAFSADEVNEEFEFLDEYLLGPGADGLPLLSEEEMEQAHREGIAQLGALILETQRLGDGYALRLAPHPIATALAFQFVLLEHLNLTQTKFTVEVGPGEESPWLRFSGPESELAQIKEMLKLKQ